MRTRDFLLGLSVFVVFCFTAAEACGDKFIVGPSGARLEQPNDAVATSARILIYRDTGSDTTSALRDPELITALKEAGHTPVAADGAQGLEQAFKGGSFDLILVDYASAQKVRDEIMTSGAHSRVVPCLNRTSRHFLSDAKREFKVVMNFPADVSSVLTTIDRAMSTR